MILTRTFLIAALSLLLLSASCGTSAAEDTTGRKKELQRIKLQMEQKKRDIKKAERKESSILSEIERIDRAVHTGEAELRAHESKLREAESALKDAEAKGAGVQREMSRQRAAYRQRVRALYKMGRSGYTIAMLSPEGLAAAARRMTYLRVIAERDRDVIASYGSALAAFQNRQAELAKRKDDIIKKKEAVASRKRELELKRRQKAEILARVRTQRGVYEQALRELEDSSAALWAMIKRAEEERKRRRLKQRPSRTAISEAHSLPSAATRARILWPVEGRVITPYGIYRHPEFGTVVFRRGIEIESRPGAEVRAAEDGTVAYADWQKGYGQIMIIEHNDGLYTLYGHLSRLDASKGEWVQRGRVIGLVGETGSSKGARLYFEIRANGEAQDPLKWLARR